MEILLVVKDNCPNCPKAEFLLEEHGVDFDKVNISDEPKYIDEYSLMGAPTVLLLDEDGNEVSRTVGTDPTDIEELVDLKEVTNED